MKAMNLHNFHTQFLPKFLIFIDIIPFEPPVWRPRRCHFKPQW